MISGLLDNRTTDLLSKTPGIGDIPILGNLFRSKNVNRTVTELAVIITPTLVDPLNENPGNPAEPNLPVPFLSTPKFDKGITPKTVEGPTKP
jgi:pilus assembly protein CpaC